MLGFVRVASLVKSYRSGCRHATVVDFPEAFKMIRGTICQSILNDGWGINDVVHKIPGIEQVGVYWYQS